MNRKLFTVGFWLGIAFFVAANLYSYNVAEPPCCDRTITFGFPLPLGNTGGFMGGSRLFLPGVIANGIVAVFTSFSFAGVFADSYPWLKRRVRALVHWHARTRA